MNQIKNILFKNPYLEFLGTWVVLFISSILVRLPHFLSKNFWFDGDEAIIGIMAQDFLEKPFLALYFYGQNYGFSIFEVLSVSIFEKILGPSVWSLRLGALLLFSLGITFLVQALKNYKVSTSLTGLIIVLVLVYPSWYLWGGMVRGGYLTAFVFACILFFLTSKRRLGVINSIIVGFALVITFESHFLILLTILPILIIELLKQKELFKKAVFIFSGAVSMWLLIHYLGKIDSIIWATPELNFGFSAQQDILTRQVQSFYHGFSNYFYYQTNLELPRWWRLLIRAFLLLSGVYLLWDYLKVRAKNKFYYVMVILSILSYFYIISIFNTVGARYWMGLFTGLLFWILYVTINNKENTFSMVVIGTLASISFLGIINGPNMSRDNHQAHINKREAFDELYQSAKDFHAKAIYLGDGLMQWQWNYLYGTEIPASSFYEVERTSKFKDQVDKIYTHNPENVVIAGIWGVFLGMEELSGFNDSRMQVGEIYFIQPNAEEQFIRQSKKVFRGE